MTFLSLQSGLNTNHFSFEKLRGNFNIPRDVLHNENGIYLNNQLCNLSTDAYAKKQNKMNSSH